MGHSSKSAPVGKGTFHLGDGKRHEEEKPAVRKPTSVPQASADPPPYTLSEREWLKEFGFD